MGWLRRAATTSALAVGFALTTAVTPASADPMPGFNFDANQLEASMDACMAYQVPEDYILMGWVNM